MYQPSYSDISLTGLTNKLHSRVFEMGIGPTPKQLEIIKQMISRETDWWYLMKLPNGQWGALWWAGLDCCHGRGLVEGNYSGLAYIGTRKDTVNYIINNLKQMANEDPVNCSFKEQYIKDLSWRKIW